MSADISEMRRRTIQYHQQQAARALALKAAPTIEPDEIPELDQPIELQFTEHDKCVQPVEQQSPDFWQEAFQWVAQEIVEAKCESHLKEWRRRGDIKDATVVLALRALRRKIDKLDESQDN